MTARNDRKPPRNLCTNGIGALIAVLQRWVTEFNVPTLGDTSRFRGAFWFTAAIGDYRVRVTPRTTREAVQRVHPRVCFCAMVGRPLSSRKVTWAGMWEPLARRQACENVHLCMRHWDPGKGTWAARAIEPPVLTDGDDAALNVLITAPIRSDPDRQDAHAAASASRQGGPGMT